MYDTLSSYIMHYYLLFVSLIKNVDEVVLGEVDVDRKAIETKEEINLRWIK